MLLKASLCQPLVRTVMSLEVLKTDKINEPLNKSIKSQQTLKKLKPLQCDKTS